MLLLSYAAGAPCHNAQANRPDAARATSAANQMFPLRLRNCRVIRADDLPEPTRYDKDSNEYVPTIDPAARAEGLAARAARSFVAPMKLPPSAGPFAVGDRVNARLRQMEAARGEAPLWYSAVVERIRERLRRRCLELGERAYSRLVRQETAGLLSRGRARVAAWWKSVVTCPLPDFVGPRAARAHLVRFRGERASRSQA